MPIRKTMKECKNLKECYNFMSFKIRKLEEYILKLKRGDGLIFRTESCERYLKLNNEFSIDIIDYYICEHMKHFKVSEMDDEFDKTINPIMKKFKDSVDHLFKIEKRLKNVLPLVVRIYSIKPENYYKVSYEYIERIDNPCMKKYNKIDTQFHETIEYLSSSRISDYIMDDPEIMVPLKMFSYTEHDKTNIVDRLDTKNKRWEKIFVNTYCKVLCIIYVDMFGVICCKEFIINEEDHITPNKIIKELKKRMVEREPKLQFSKNIDILKNLCLAIYGNTYTDEDYRFLISTKIFSTVPNCRYITKMIGKNIFDEVRLCGKRVIE